MRKITLHSPAITNAGSYIDAGTTAEVGTGDNQVAASLADEMVGSARAIPADINAVTPAPAVELVLDNPVPAE